MFSIGQFSRLTRLSVKALRHYHEVGLLVPDHIDDETGYRYYGEGALDRARIISALKELDLPLKAITELLDTVRDDTDLVGFLEEHREDVAGKIAHYRNIQNTIDALLVSARLVREAGEVPADLSERELSPTLFAGVRMRGKYAQIAQAFKTVGRRAGLRIMGPGTGLFYDEGYEEESADFEGGFPVRSEVIHEDIDCRILSGGTAMVATHVGPYETIHMTYQFLVQEMERRGLKSTRPSREVYLKGPGMIFRGNPARYQTEIQFLLV
ncbi:MAG: MerR family transcriptional regulator [Myxococcota bacterium]